MSQRECGAGVQSGCPGEPGSGRNAAAVFSGSLRSQRTHGLWDACRGPLGQGLQTGPLHKAGVGDGGLDLFCSNSSWLRSSPDENCPALNLLFGPKRSSVGATKKNGVIFFALRPAEENLGWLLFLQMTQATKGQAEPGEVAHVKRKMQASRRPPLFPVGLEGPLQTELVGRAVWLGLRMCLSAHRGMAGVILLGSLSAGFLSLTSQPPQAQVSFLVQTATACAQLCKPRPLTASVSWSPGTPNKGGPASPPGLFQSRESSLGQTQHLPSPVKLPVACLSLLGQKNGRSSWTVMKCGGSVDALQQ